MLRRTLSARTCRKWVKPETLDFGCFQLTIDPTDFGGQMYRDPAYWAELNSPLELEIVQRFRPNLFLDVGANYGFTTLVHHSLNPGCSLVAIEPDPRIAKFLRQNLQANGCTTARVIEAVCSDRDGVSSLAINPASSQDNRVIGQAAWKTLDRPSISVSTTLSRTAPRGLHLHQDRHTRIRAACPSRRR